MAIVSTTKSIQEERLAREVVLASETRIMAGTFERPVSLHVPDQMEPGAAGAAIGHLLIPAGAPRPAVRRLVVLLPDADVDEAGLAAFIWSMAKERALEVLLLGTLPRPREQYRARRRLVTIAAITRDDTVHVDIELLPELSWEQAVRRVWQPGDLIVCHSELTETGGLIARPLAQSLLHSLAAPVYLVSGFYPELLEERVSGLVRLGEWIPPAVIMVAFFGLQVRLAQATAGNLQTIALVLTVLFEFLLIAAWERFLNTLV